MGGGAERIFSAYSFAQIRAPVDDYFTPESMEHSMGNVGA
jgi:hypothetical protein